MKKVTACLFIGLIIFTAGVYLSTLLTTRWIVIGVLLSGFGGILMGGSSYFLPKPIKK